MKCFGKDHVKVHGATFCEESSFKMLNVNSDTYFKSFIKIWKKKKHW